MLSDVYRSRFGLLATPPVPSVVVRGSRGGGIGVPSLPVPVETITEVVADTLAGAPVPIVASGPSVITLLPLVDPTDVATVHSALRAEFPSLDVSRRSMTLDALVGLGPLTGRLRAASDRTGMA
jgi:hypothetical protein